MKLKIKETYLILLIVISLISLGVYSTYALFTASTTIEDAVGISTTLDIGKSISEYEIVSVSPGDTKLIELNVVNSSSNTIYYGAWYKIVEGNQEDIEIGLYTEVNSNSSSGTLSSSASINLLVGITNNSDTTITIYLGVKGSTTNELNISSDKTLLPNDWTQGYTVNLTVVNGISNVSSVKVNKGSNAIFNITANDNYSLNIDSDTCNGSLDISTGIYTITNVTESKNCILTLREIKPANSPDLVQGLIPITYQTIVDSEGNINTKVLKADSTNSNNSWYNYDNKRWANAVLVSKTNRSTYQSASVGTEISESHILAYYVWIPRYKYKVWNIKKIIGISSYNDYYPYLKGIDIVFENEKESTGTIECTYSYSSPSSDAGSPNEDCGEKNGEYYTHPAFTFGSDEVRGFWIGKYEVSSSDPQTGSSYGGGRNTSLTIRILPNVTSWRFNTLSNFNTIIQNMQKSSNIYGLSTSRTNTDSHILTNMEWGAVAYLSHSNYGKCSDNGCEEVAINQYGDEEDEYFATMTGCGPAASKDMIYSTTCNAYNTTLGMTASTTGNVTGVYDMSGGAFEAIMGNISSEIDVYTFNSGDTSSYGFGSTWYETNNNSKYVTTYAYGTSSKDQTAYNRGRLGDATGEVVSSSYAWYTDEATFPNLTSSWFRRGQRYSPGSVVGIFAFADINDNVFNAITSTRAALISLSN